MSVRYRCKLSPELLKKAVDELNEPEDNDVRLQNIDQLREKFKEEAKGLELIRSDDAFLLRFLRVRKFNLAGAVKTLVNYHKQRKDWKELFDMVDNPKECEDLLREGPVLHIRDARARDGSFILLGRPGYGFKGKRDMLKFIALIILTVEKLLEQEEFQIYGLTVIEDMADFGMSTAMQMTSHGRKFLFVMQEAMPIRVKSVNMVNEALVFDAIYAIISKFMKEKMKKRLRLHGSTFKTLHEVIHPSHLPFSLGGTGPDLDPRWWSDQLLSSEGGGEDTEL